MDVSKEEKITALREKLEAARADPAKAKKVVKYAKKLAILEAQVTAEHNPKVGLFSYSNQHTCCKSHPCDSPQ